MNQDRGGPGVMMALLQSTEYDFRGVQVAGIRL